MAASQSVANAPEATHVRGTLLGGSLRAIDDNGLREVYYEALPVEHRDAMMALVPMTWVPMERALAHYQVLNELVTDPAMQRRAGHVVGERVQRSYLSTLVRALSVTGLVDPRRLLSQMPKIWARVIQGGSIAVDDAGPKDLEVRVSGVPLFGISYFRGGWIGVWESSLSLVSRTVYVKPKATRDEQYRMIVSWV